MNKFFSTAVVTGALIISSISVYAGASCGAAGAAGCSASKSASCASGASCAGGTSCASGPSCHNAATTVSPESVAAFNKESLNLQKQLIDKFGEYKKESLEATPNPDRLAQIKRDMLTLQASVQKIADKYGIPATGCAGGAGGSGGSCHK